MKRALMFIVPLVLVVVGVAAFWIMYLARPVAEVRIPEVQPPLVRTVEVEPTDLQLTVESQGTVAARTESTMVPEVSGRVIEVAPSLVAGGFFENGEVLLALDPTDYELDVIRAKMEVARAEVALAREEAEADIARQEWTDLRGEEHAPPLTSRELQLSEARAAVEAAKAVLERERTDLARTLIRAPYAGRVREKMVDLGQYVTPGQALAKVYAVDRADIRLPLPDAELAFVAIPLDYRDRAKDHTAPKVILRADFAGAVHQWEGRIVRTEGEIDPKTRMVHVVAEVDDPYGRGDDPDRPPLAVGMFVEAEIEGRLVENVVVLPRAALRADGRVWVVGEDDRLEFRDVDIARAGREQIVVRAGLARGERVVLSPLAAATDGMRVRVLDRQEPGG